MKNNRKKRQEHIKPEKTRQDKRRPEQIRTRKENIGK